MSLVPTKNAQGRYDNVDFAKAAGFKYPPIKCSYLKRDVLLFANSIGIPSSSLHFLYELHPSFSAFPTFPSNLAFKQTSQEVFDFFARTLSAAIPGTPPFDPQHSVDGERGIEILRPIPPSSAGLDLEINNRVVGVYDKGGHMILEAEGVLRDAATDTPYARMTSTAFGIGQGGYGGPPGPPSTLLQKPPPRQPDATHVFRTSPEQALLYRLCGDYNPLHADPAYGHRAGFQGTILQGLATWNIAAHGLLQAVAASDPHRFKSFSARFMNVVYPGDVLETRMWRLPSRDGFDEILFETIVQSDGRVALSNGFARLVSENLASSF